MTNSKAKPDSENSKAEKLTHNADTDEINPKGKITQNALEETEDAEAAEGLTQGRLVEDAAAVKKDHGRVKQKPNAEKVAQWAQEAA